MSLKLYKVDFFNTKQFSLDLYGMTVNKKASASQFAFSEICYLSCHILLKADVDLGTLKRENAFKSIYVSNT